MRTARTLLALVALLLCLPLAAQMPQNFERGFAPEKAYHFGDLDHVNLFNGNLVIAIPIGSPYPLGGGTSYGFSLVYNANVWNFVDVTPITTPPWSGHDKPWAYPNGQSNAGLGWSLSLGRIVTRDDPNNRLMAPAYISPDGNEHQVDLSSGIHMTTDGTSMRWNTDHLETPDGATRTFFMDPSLYSTNGFGWLHQMTDAFGNSVVVTQCFNSTTGMLEKWTITDNLGRTHYVHFKPFNSSTFNSTFTTLQNYKTVVSSVDLQNATGREVYTFTYANDAGVVDQPTTVNVSTKADAQGWPLSFDLPVLRKITLPDNSTYEASYLTPRALYTDGENGVISSLQLPTRGSISWTYGSYLFPKFTCDDNGWVTGSKGVIARTLKDKDGTTVLGTTTYTNQLTDSVSVACQGTQPLIFKPIYQQMTNTVMLSNGRKEVNHFTTVLPEAGAASTLSDLEYGFPICRLTTDGTSYQRGISVESYDCSSGTCGTTPRKKYVDYLINSQDLTVRSERMLYEDGKYVDTINSDRDAYNHWLTTTTQTNFTNAFGVTESDRTTHTNYLAPDSTHWNLNRYDYQTVTEGTHGSKTLSCFDARGFLMRTRVLKADTSNTAYLLPAVDDLVTVYTDEDDGLGNVTHEKYYGGDGASLNTTDFCTMELPASPSYELKHTYSYGVRATTEYRDGATTVLQPVNKTIYPNGLVNFDTDPSGLMTTYAYTSWGAYSAITPPGQAATTFSYQIATPSAQAKTTLAQSDQSVTYAFDGLGRLTHEKRRLPDVNNQAQYSVRETTYDTGGRKSTVSEFEPLPAGVDETAFHPTHKTTFTYDAFDRSLSVTAPDNAATTFSYTAASSMTRTVNVATSSSGQSAVPVTETYDSRGRIATVRERSGSTSATNTTGGYVLTRYSYDLGGHLSNVSMWDESDPTRVQTRGFTYDNRGFLLSESHPEIGYGNGSISYFNYDARGHAGRKITGSGTDFDLTFVYDKAERLTDINDAQSHPLKHFVFGSAFPDAAYRTGRLQTAVRHNRISTGDFRVTEDYEYGSKGLTTKRTTSVDFLNETTQYVTPVKSFTQTFAYDINGLMASQNYPSATSVAGTPNITSMSNTFASGFLTGTGTIASSTTATFGYHPNGMLKTVDHGNSIIDTYDIDSTNAMGRPSKITFAGYSAGCTPPAAPAINTFSAMCPNSTMSASTTASATTYAWSIQNGSIIGSPSGSSVNFSAGTSGTVTLTLTITNSCGAQATSSMSIAIRTPPTTTLSASATQVAPGTVVNLRVDFTGTAPWQINWTDGTYTNGITANPYYRPVTVNQTTTYQIDGGADNYCGSNPSNAVTVTVTSGTPPPVPTAVAAAATSTTSVIVSWAPVTGADSYEILRSTTVLPGMNINNYTVVGSTSSASFTDNTASANTAYFYRVRSVKGTGAGALRSDGSNYDLATTTMFTGITQSQTLITPAFFTELRTAVNAVRTLANLGGGSYSNDLSVPNRIKAVHLTELRTALDQARSALGLSAISYGESINSNTTFIKKTHFDELRGGVQ